MLRRKHLPKKLLKFAAPRAGRGGCKRKEEKRSFLCCVSLRVIALILLLFTFSASAATFNASLDRDTISLGENATLTLFFEGGEPAAVPRLPQVAGLNF